MAKFGKLKKFIRKVPASPAPEGDTPGSAPTTPAGALKPAVDLPEMGATPKATNQSEEVHTEADDVLDGILQDLNIKVGQLVVEDAQKADTVSEYSGGSAKSVDDDEGEEEDGDDEEDDDNEEEEGEEDDDDEEVIHKLVSPKNDSKKKHKKTSSVGDRVAAVVAAADEIRERKQRRGTPSPTTTETSKKSGEVTTPLTEPGFPEKKNGAAPATAAVHAPSPSLSKKEQSSRRSSKKEQAPKKTSDGGEKRKSKKQQKKLKEVEEQMKIAVEQQEQPDRPENQSELPPAMPKKEKKGKKSPLLPLMPKSKSRTKAATPPAVSPEVQQASDGEGAAPTLEEHQVISKTFDDDDQTKSTVGFSDEGTFDETLESRVTQSMSDTLDGSTLEDEQRMLGKKTVMNKDIIIHGPGGPSALVVRAMYYTPLPANPDDIVIKVEASTVSFRDCLLRLGIGPDKVPFPFVPGCEVVGTISNLGKTAKLEGYRVGDRVVGMTRGGGGNGFYAKLPMKCVAPVLSTGIDAADAVCLVDVYMTAYQAIRIGKKDGTPLTEANVLITDGYSPVGQAAVQLAKLEGANVYVTTTESRQDEYMKGLGVRVLPLVPSKWLHKLKGKMDIVIDNTCFDSYDSSWKALNATGVLVCTGTTSLYSFQDHGSGGCGGCDALGDLRDYQVRWAKMKAKYMMSQTKFHDLWESFQTDPKKYQQELKYLCFLVESGMLKPKISERVSIEEVPDAQRYLETGKANGTIVCLP